MRLVKNAAFTLIELSIVLVIIGLLISGVLYGRDLIMSAKLRSIGKEQIAYQTAFATFRSKYNGLPGDITNPGSMFSLSACSRTAGNGDNLIVWTGEGAAAWCQLAEAKMIPGISNATTGACPDNCIGEPGVTIPKSVAMPNAGWTIEVNVAKNKNALLYGAQTSNFLAYGPVLMPLEAYSLDSKMDDGKPDGKMEWNNITGYADCRAASAFNVSTKDQVCSFNVELGL
jgi:prepilin-type N-terminal cleavage/methylation domain-containing protein